MKNVLQGFEILTDGVGRFLPALPRGNPLFTIKLSSLPSWNEIISENNPYTRSKITKLERGRGYEIGIALAKKLEVPLRVEKCNPNGKSGKPLRDAFRDVWTYPLTNKKLFCFVKIWRPFSIADRAKSNRTRDIYNLALKGLIDGLTDAGLWADDNELIHRDFMISYQGLDKETRIEIEFYENGD